MVKGSNDNVGVNSSYGILAYDVVTLYLVIPFTACSDSSHKSRIGPQFHTYTLETHLIICYIFF